MLLTDVDLSVLKPTRSGIIPFVKKNGRIWFLMGVDTDTGELSDFGGGVKAYEHAMSAGLRECVEETRGIIDFKDLGIIRNAIYSKKGNQEVCIMFAEVKKEGFFESARKDFHRKGKMGTYHEMKDIVWIPDDEMLKIVRLTNRKSKIWARIRYVLSKCGSFNQNFITRLYNQ